jgi:hypothetical protein
VVSFTLWPRFTPGERTPVPIVQDAGWAPELVWTQRLEEKSFCLCRGSNLDRQVVQSVVRHYTDWATPALLLLLLLQIHIKASVGAPWMGIRSSQGLCYHRTPEIIVSFRNQGCSFGPNTARPSVWAGLWKRITIITITRRHCTVGHVWRVVAGCGGQVGLTINGITSPVLVPVVTRVTQRQCGRLQINKCTARFCRGRVSVLVVGGVCQSAEGEGWCTVST